MFLIYPEIIILNICSLSSLSFFFGAFYSKPPQPQLDIFMNRFSFLIEVATRIKDAKSHPRMNDVDCHLIGDAQSEKGEQQRETMFCP
jgi:hypothetical protein